MPEVDEVPGARVMTSLLATPPPCRRSAKARRCQVHELTSPLRRRGSWRPCDVRHAPSGHRPHQGHRGRRRNAQVGKREGPRPGRLRWQWFWDEEGLAAVLAMVLGRGGASGSAGSGFGMSCASGGAGGSS
eukprot:247593-Chlamydomonas_euryale.AAC.4